MKKLLSIVLLASLILPFVGTVSWLNYQKKTVRRQIKHQIMVGIDKDELVMLTFTREEATTELKWKHSKEFGYRESMYDIVEADTSGNTITYWCWWDYQETKLNKQLYRLLADFLGSDNKNKDTRDQFMQFYKSLYCSEKSLWTADVPDLGNQRKSGYQNSYTSIQLTPPTPPPNFI